MQDMYEVDYIGKIKKELTRCIKKAGDELYLFDRNLIYDSSYENVHAHERSICFRFGVYLNNQMSMNRALKKYDLDVEYNKDIDTIKRLSGWPNGCYPDLIIHKRGTNTANLLVMECKGWWSDERDILNDKKKIREFLNSERYRYLFGLLIVFEREKIRFDWIEKET